MINQNTSQNTDLGFWRSYKEGYLWAWVVAVLVYVILPIPMWAVNITDILWLRIIVNIPLSLLGVIAILFFGLRPTHQKWSLIVGGVNEFLMDRDTSQGVAGGPRWLWRLVITAAYAFGLIGVALSTWSFAKAPGAFWVIYLVGFVLVLWNQVYQAKGKIMKWLAVIYMAVCIIVMIALTIFDTTTGTELFDENGRPQVMGRYVDGKFRAIGDKHPSECVPERAAHSWEIFDFSSNNEKWLDEDKRPEAFRPADGCWDNGIPLTVPTPEDVPETANFSAQALLDLATKTPKEVADAKAKANAEAMLAEARRKQEAKSVAEAKAYAAERARWTANAAAAPAPPSRTPATWLRECGGRWRGLLNCQTVGFKENEFYMRRQKDGFCLVADSPDDFLRFRLEDNDVKFVPVGNSKPTGYFFDLKVGETWRDVTCMQQEGKLVPIWK